MGEQFRNSNERIYHKLPYLLTLVMFMLMISCFGIWAVIDALKLQSSDGMNPWQFVAGLIVTVLGAYRLPIYVGKFVLRRAPFLEISELGIIAPTLQSNVISWDQIKRFELEEHDDGTIFPPLKWLFPRLFRYVSLKVILKNDIRANWWNDFLIGNSIRLGGLDNDVATMLNILRKYKSVKYVKVTET